MPDEETFAIRLPDGTQVRWTAAQITEYQCSWKAELAQGKVTTSLSVEQIRKIIREELHEMLPEVTRQVLASLARELRMGMNIRGRRESYE